MSHLPLLLSLAEDLENFKNPYASDYEFGYRPQQRIYDRGVPSTALHLVLPSICRNAIKKKQSGENPVSTVGKDGFQVCMDVQQFKPNELTVKTIDNCVIVEGKHEEREDEHGFITRHFVRRYTLPKNFDPNQAISTISSDGILTVKIPPPPKSKESNERIIQIQQTGPAHLSVKENPKTDETNSGEKAASEN